MEKSNEKILKLQSMLDVLCDYAGLERQAYLSNSISPGKKDWDLQNNYEALKKEQIKLILCMFEVEIK